MRQITFPKLDGDYRALAGGLDLVTPRMKLDAGKVIDACNYEPLPIGGYRRINGHERYDGRASPTKADYWSLPATITGTIPVGSTLTGLFSAATARVLGVFGTTIVLARLVGAYVTNEPLRVAGVTVATSTDVATKRGAASASDDADWRLLAANDQRADIAAVPGSGPVRGIFVQGGITYAFRDNAGGTQSILWKATATGWLQVSLGSELEVRARQGLSGAATISVGTPGVVTWFNHGLANGQGVQFTDTLMPGGITAGTTYYVKNRTTNTFEVAATPGGASINTTGSSTSPTTTLVTSPGVSVGDTITGSQSGATGVVTAVAMQKGTWTNQPYAVLTFTTISGSFFSGEALEGISGLCVGQAYAGSQPITRFPGGTVETISANFTGSTGTKRTYGADGANFAFEFDGTTYVKLRTGMIYDMPTHVFEFRNYLFLSFAGGSVQFSGLGAPYSWSLVLGAGEIGTGAEVSGFAQLAATQAGAAMGIFTDGKHFTLYGTSASNFVMVPSNSDIGFAAHTIQNVANNVYGLTARGLQSLTTTLNYGDFEFAALSFFVQPLLNLKMGLSTASAALKNKNQYRIFFSDGTGLAVGLTGEKLAGIMPLNYGKVVRCMTTATLPSGQEVTFFASDDGFVYQDNVGTSFDGAAIEAWLRPAFNNLKSPRVRKQYRRAVFEAECEGFSQVNIRYDLGYANGDAAQPSVPLVVAMAGTGGFWDEITWDTFTWDSPVVNTADVSLDGSENNIGFLVYTNRAQDDPHTFQGVNLLYSPRRIVHSGS